MRNQGDCQSHATCPPHKPYRCFNGRCAKSPALCVYTSYAEIDRVGVSVESSERVTHKSFWFWHWEYSEQVFPARPFPFTLCSNGLFQDAAFCGVIPACQPFKPKRCPSGECVGLNEACRSVTTVTAQTPAKEHSLTELLFPHRTSNSFDVVDAACFF